MDARRRAAQQARAIADLPPVLDSLFEEVIESWLALQLPASQATPAVLGRLGTLAYRYTSRVSLEADAVLLEVQGSVRLFGGIQALCAQLLERCRSVGLEPRWALAPTPLAALVLARAGRSVMVRARDRLVGELAPLPVESLGWSAETPTGYSRRTASCVRPLRRQVGARARSLQQKRAPTSPPRHAMWR